MKIEIKHRITGKIILCGEYESIKQCLEKNRDADLRGADLRGAYLRDAYFNGEKLTKAPLQLLGLKYDVLITSEQIKIGCEIHKVEDWKKFTDKQIIKMNGEDSLKVWKKHKKMIFDLHKLHVG